MSGQVSKITLIIIGVAVVFGLTLLSCGGSLNTNQNEHFTADGRLIPDTTAAKFNRELPSKVKFYVEVSGSMNGFFRPNCPTGFKTDVWDVVSSYQPFSEGVTVLTNDGDVGAHFTASDFRANMNTGAFVSSASTKVPLMLQSIMSNLNADAGEVAVLVSDMKYSPVGAAAPSVLMSQYKTDINRLMNNFGQAVSVVCATSNYIDKSGSEITNRSPYYYVILGRPENIADVRNDISLLLKKNGSFVDNMESGFNYGHPKYSFGISNKCDQLDEEPTFVGYEEAEDGDTCTIKLKVPLEDYRWLIAEEDIFRDAFQAKTLYGSGVKVSSIEMDVKDVSGPEKHLKREAEGIVSLKIFDMPTESDVIEWNIALPITNYYHFNEFLEGAADENDPTKSYSVEDFLKGIFQGGMVTRDLLPNYILVTKEN